MVVGANLPDGDLVWSLGELAYLHYHRGWTHSFFGVAACALALWAVLLALARWGVGRGPLRPAALLAACLCGVGSHFLMDATNAYGIRPWLPWNDRWVYLDLWVIVDPWVWWILGAAWWLGGKRTPLRTVTGCVAGAAIAALLFSVDAVPRWAGPLALVALVGVVLAALRTRIGMRPQRLARGALVSLVAYAALCAVSGALAAGRLEAWVARTEVFDASAAAVLPRPADPFRWDAIVEEPDGYLHRVFGAVAALDPPAPNFRRYAARLDSVPARAFLGTCAGRVVTGFFRFPYGTIETDAAGRREWVVRDARFARGERRGFGTYAVTLGEDGVPDLSTLPCP